MKIKNRNYILTLILSLALAVNIIPIGANAGAVYADSEEPGPVLSAGRYVIRPLVSETRTLTVKNASKKSGANIFLYSCDMANDKLFDVSFDSKGYARIKNVNSKKYIGVSGSKIKKGSNVVQLGKSSSKKQRWVLEPAGTKNGQNVFRVRSAASKKYYLQLKGGKDRNASNIRVWTKNKSSAEKFVFVSTKSVATPAPAAVIKDGIYKVGSALSSSLALSIPNDSLKNGAVPALKSKNSSLSQMFMFTYKGGYYQIRSIISGKSVTVKGGNVLAKTPAIQYSDSDKPYQRFKLVKQTDGTYQIIARSGGLALRVSSGVAASGRALETWYPSSVKSQSFTLTPVTNVKLSSDIYSISPYSKDGINLTIIESSRASGASVGADKDDRTFTQKFRIVKVSGNEYSIENMNSGLLLTASGSTIVQKKGTASNPSKSQLWIPELTLGGMKFLSKSAGKAMELTGSSGNYSVKLANSSNSTKQAFLPEVTALFDTGQYRLDNAGSAGSLEVADASFFKLANIQTATADGSGTQTWYLKKNSDGTVTIKNERSGKSAEIASAINGANVRQNKSSSAKAQKWFIEECGGGWFRLRSASTNGIYLDAGAPKDAAGKSNVLIAAGDAATAIDAQKWRFTPVELENAGPEMPKAAADAVEKEARKHLGKPYVFGASGPKTFDCSGYIYYVMNQSGIREMSRVTAQDIYDSCIEIPSKSAKRGDLIFFKNTYKTDRTVTHVGIYLGSGKMIHAGSPVQVSKVDSEYFKAHFYTYGRLA